jgi:hypothetical protein
MHTSMHIIASMQVVEVGTSVSSSPAIDGDGKNTSRATERHQKAEPSGRLARLRANKLGALTIQESQRPLSEHCFKGDWGDGKAVMLWLRAHCKERKPLILAYRSIESLCTLLQGKKQSQRYV